MRVRRLYQIVVAAGVIGVLSASASFATGSGSTTYYGLLARESPNVVAELECAYSAGACSKIATNKFARIYDSPEGDLVRVSGRFRDRRDDSKAAYVKTSWLGSAQACVSGGIGIDATGATAQLCTGWGLKLGTKSTAQVSAHTTTAYQSFTQPRTFGPGANAMRAATYVCVNNTLWYDDICSGSRLLTANV